MGNAICRRRASRGKGGGPRFIRLTDALLMHFHQLIEIGYDRLALIGMRRPSVYGRQ